VSGALSTMLLSAFDHTLNLMCFVRLKPERSWKRQWARVGSTREAKRLVCGPPTLAIILHPEGTLMMRA